MIAGKNMTNDITIRDEYIRLGQAMKLAGMVQTGAEAKELIESGEVLVNGEKEQRRGRKLYDGAIVEWDGQRFMVHTPANTSIPQQTR